MRRAYRADGRTMTPIALIEAAATLLWTYAALTFAAWVNHARCLERSAHIPALIELLTHLVPAMIALVVTVLIGALIGLPSVVAFIALLFPAGLAYGTHTALTETQATRLAPRLIATALIATVLIAGRQIL